MRSTGSVLREFSRESRRCAENWGGNMVGKCVCFGTLALAFMSSAYPQGVAPQAAPIQVPAPASPQAVVPPGSGTPPIKVQPGVVTQSNPDPALQRFSRGFERNKDSFVAPTMNIDIKASGISLPKCVSEAKEGKGCE